MELRRSGLRAGVYVDVENTTRNGGRGLRFDVLRDFACRDGADALRLNAYLAYDAERARHDPYYRNNAMNFHFAMRSVGFKVIEKPVQWFTNEDGVSVSKANSDLDLAVDMLLQSARLDRVVLVSGDGDFVQVVRALQNSGCRVELVAFQSVSYNLRCEADLFVSGFLIPGLSPQPPVQGSDRRVHGATSAREFVAPAGITTPTADSVSFVTWCTSTTSRPAIRRTRIRPTAMRSSTSRRCRWDWIAVNCRTAT